MFPVMVQDKKFRNSLPSHAYGSDWTKKHEYNFLINFSMLFKFVAVQIWFNSNKCV